MRGVTIFFRGLFFAPHYEIADNYKSICKGKLNLLTDRYDVDTAIIENCRPSLQIVFLRHENWFPRAIDEGNILFYYQSNCADSVVLPEILLSNEEICALPEGPFQNNLLRNLVYLIPKVSLLEQGHIGATRKYLEKYEQRFANLDAQVDFDIANLQKRLYKTLNSVEKHFGKGYSSDLRSCVKQKRKEKSAKR